MNIRKLMVICGVVVINNSFAADANSVGMSESQVYANLVPMYYKPVKYVSSDLNVHFEYMMPVLKNDNKGFISKVNICNSYQCKKFNYDINEVKVTPIEPALLSFKAKLNNDDNYLTGFICHDHSYECKSYVIYDIKVNNQDIEQKFYLSLESEPINVAKLK